MKNLIIATIIAVTAFSATPAFAWYRGGGGYGGYHGGWNGGGGWNRPYYGGYNRGWNNWGPAAGAALGLGILGGALATQQYYQRPVVPCDPYYNNCY